MEVWPLGIRIIKAHDLKDVNFMTKMDVYAVVSISGDHIKNQRQKTPLDKDGGTSPKWNFPMEFTVDDDAMQENRLTLKIKLVSDRSLGNRKIGVVYVQIKELFDNSLHREGDGESKSSDAGEEEKSGTYSVRLTNGKAKGTLDLAYKFGERYTVEPPSPPTMAETYNMKGVEAPTVMAYPSTFPGSSSSYPQPTNVYPQPPSGGYPYPASSGAYPPPHPGAYPPQQGGYGYGGYQPPQSGYGYLPMQAPHNPKKSSGGGMAMGLGAGLLGGLLIGDMMSDF